MKQSPSSSLTKQFSFSGIGTIFYILTDTPLKESYKKHITEYVNNFESKYSRFRENSNLSRLNNSKKITNPSQEMQDMLIFALQTYKDTNGLFNISIGARLEQQGYGQPKDTESVVSNNLPDDVFVSPTKIAINPKIRLDFGGFGKGWFIDELSSSLERWGINNYLINGGGDIKVGKEPTEILIENPLNNKEQIGRLIISNNSFGASSNVKRKWRSPSGAQQYAHIQRPDNQPLTNNIVMTAAVSNTAVQADVLATCLLLDPSLKQISKIKHWGEYCLVLDNFKILHTKGFSLINP